VRYLPTRTPVSLPKVAGSRYFYVSRIALEDHLLPANARGFCIRIGWDDWHIDRRRARRMWRRHLKNVAKTLGIVRS
jgi:hypothetical protein